jgi:hypothetical protein
LRFSSELQRPSGMRLNGPESANMKKIRKQLAAFPLLFMLVSCSGNNYRVIERGPVDDAWVKIVLEHNGRILFTRCNNDKATADPTKIERCDLHVGQVVKCQFFADHLSFDAGGYNLICGDQRENGKLTTDGRNELLVIEREVIQ